MPSGTWALGWATGDLVPTVEFAKGVGAIFDQTLGSDQASFDATPIVGSYAHLLIELYARTSEVVNTSDVLLRFNNDSGTNYTYHYMQALGTVVSATSAATQNRAMIGCCPGNNAAATEFGSLTCTVLNYAGSTNRKSLHADSSAIGAENMRRQNGAIWGGTAAVTRVTVMPGAGNFKAGSRMTIYAMGA